MCSSILDSMDGTSELDAHVLEVSAPSTPSANPPKPVKKGRGAGKRLTDRERLEILELFDKSGGAVSNAEVARRYGITRAAIQKLKLKGDEVRARYRHGSADSRDGRKRGSHVVSVPFEEELFEWVKGLRARKVPVPPSLVKEKARLLVPKYSLGNFQASNGWYYNFCKRFNLNADKKEETDEQLQSLEAYDQQLQQYQQMTALAATTLQQQQLQIQEDRMRQLESKSERMLEMLQQQNRMIEAQNQRSEEQADTLRKILAQLHAKDSAVL